MITETIRGDWIGRVIDGRFTLLEWLGGSEWGAVFLTEAPGEGSRKAAIKLIPADAADAEARLAGWAAAASLSHPHLMRLFHCGRCEIGAVRLIYAVTEYTDEILSQILLERPLTPAEAAEMLDPVLDALAYLHGQGFAHGRLQPSEIMAVDDQLKLSCDNLQRTGEPGKHLLAPGVHVAPEAALGVISPANDLWSLGVTLVEALTQHPPVWERTAHGEPVVPGSIPQPFAGIARECLRVEPERRCTLGDVKARLEAARAGKTGRSALAKLRGPAIAGAALVLLAAVAALLLRSHPAEPSPPAAEEQSAPAMAALPPASPAPSLRTQSFKAATGKGAVAEQVMPDVPEKVRATIHGKFQVSIRVAVDAGGNVTNAAADSPGPSKYFAKAALQAAQRWRFKPPQVNGQAVSSEWVLRFEFGQAATEVTPVETSP